LMIFLGVAYLTLLLLERSGNFRVAEEGGRAATVQYQYYPRHTAGADLPWITSSELSSSSLSSLP
jgi:hypothetical protein